jgi:hypothetical protein
MMSGSCSEVDQRGPRQKQGDEIKAILITHAKERGCLGQGGCHGADRKWSNSDR